MTYTPITMPGADTLLMSVLRAALPDIGIGTIVPADLIERLPYIVARTYGGDTPDPRFAYRANIQVDAYHTDRPPAAELAERARAALLSAWLNDSYTDVGTIARVTVMSSPYEIRDLDASSLHDTYLPSGLSRYHATYMLTIRP